MSNLDPGDRAYEQHQISGNSPPRPAVRDENISQKPALRRDGRSHAGARDRREHGNVHGNSRRVAEATRIPRTGPAGAHNGRRYTGTVRGDEDRCAIFHRNWSLAGPENLTLAGAAEAEVMWAARVSASFLRILGVDPILGCGFLPKKIRPAARLLQ
jgi:hypothetical protein